MQNCKRPHVQEATKISRGRTAQQHKSGTCTSAQIDVVHVCTKEQTVNVQLGNLEVWQKGNSAKVIMCSGALVQLTRFGESVQRGRDAIVHICTMEPMPMTKVVAVTINKGGAGKTMLSRSLATAAAEAGLSVLILDMDTQQNSTSWRKRRPKEIVLPLVEFTTENDLEETLTRARAAECDLVIIDTPPGRSTEAPAAVEVADLVLIPCSPDVEAFEGLPRTARLARTTGKTAVVVPNFVQPNSRSEQDAIRGVAEAQGLPTVPVALHRFNVHRDGSLRGLTAQELQRDSRAAAEVGLLWDWLRSELQLTTIAIVHKVA
jgi:chromosome partitioning protein